MWVYLVIYLFVHDVQIPCPKGVKDCCIYHTRTDTTTVVVHRYCARWEAHHNYRNAFLFLDAWGGYLIMDGHKYNAVKFDSIFVRRE